MQVGFSVVSRHEQVEFRFFGPHTPRLRPLVTFAQEAGLHVALMGRLYYRSELLAQLPAGPAQEESASDATLALAAYRRWGREGLARLEGDFAVVVWDARRKILVGARDPLGGYPLFWTTTAGVFALATGLRPLLELLPHRSLNCDFLAEFLMLPTLSAQEFPIEQCVYEGVQRVQAGTMVQIAVPSGRVDRHLYWDWLERRLDPGTTRLEEISEQVSERLWAAVRERVTGRTAAHLSGGMDSTAVALLARDELRRRPGQPLLHALSLVYDRLDVLGRETPYLESALRGQEGIVAHRVAADDLFDYDSFLDPPFHDEPCASLRGLGIDRPLLEVAARAGVDTLLTGHGADDLLDGFPFHMTSLLRRGRLWAAWNEACAWARATNNSPWQFLCSHGLANLVPAWLRGGIGPLLRGGYASWQKQGLATIAPWIRRDFARRHGLRGRGLANLRRLYSSTRSVGLSVALAAVKSYGGDHCRWSMAAPLGMTLSHPFLDPRLVRLGLGIQERFRQDPGQPKPILAHALRGVLPEDIRTRRRKGHFNEVYYLGLSRHLPALEALIRRAPVDDLGLLDRDVLLACLRRAALGIAHSSGGLTRLDLTLALLLWLSKQDQWQRPLAGPVEVIRTTPEQVACHAGA
jgi:asparagine synthase (glutamine-hydrolysing)